jgi:hypothetical protein
MMGIIFTEFLELVEDKFNYGVVDQLLNECDLDSGGIYTSVGTYDHEELVDMVIKLSDISNTPTNELMKIFGQYLFPRLIEAHGELVKDINDSLTLISRVDNYVHVEVLKLYPNADLPSFQANRISENELQLNYSSKKPLASFAEGMMYGCAEYFDEHFEIKRSNGVNDSETNVHFQIIRHISNADHA